MEFHKGIGIELQTGLQCLESQHGDFRSSKLNSLKSGSHTLKSIFFGSQLSLKGKKQFEVSQDYVPKSLSQPLAQAKNGDEQFWK